MSYIGLRHGRANPVLGAHNPECLSRSVGVIGFILERPMTLGLLALAVLLVILPSYRARRARTRAQGVADGD